MFIQDSRRSYRTYAYNRLMFIQDYRSYRTYAYNRLMFIQDSRRSLQNLYLYYGVYTCSEVLVGIVEITERILILQNLFLYGSTCKYYKTYTDLTELILVFRSTYWYFRSYTCITELINVCQILYMYITELIHVLRNLYRSYRTYTGISEHIPVFWI